jgi:hypothetical protein
MTKGNKKPKNDKANMKPKKAVKDQPSQESVSPFDVLRAGAL